MSPESISVTTSGVELVPTLAPGAKQSFLILGRQDADARLVLLSFGESNFTADNAAFWIGPGERHVITPDSVVWPLLHRGVFAKIATGAAISVQVQRG